MIPGWGGELSPLYYYVPIFGLVVRGFLSPGILVCLYVCLSVCATEELALQLKQSGSTAVAVGEGQVAVMEAALQHDPVLAATLKVTAASSQSAVTASH